jgi:hypothetical protein
LTSLVSPLCVFRPCNSNMYLLPSVF